MTTPTVRILFALAVFGFLFTGCSTKKKGFVNRTYHGVTTKYNGYWNGRESVREGVKKLEKSQVDDYEQILPVFPVGDSKSGSSVSSEMNRGIDKASMVIGKHSMLIKNKEYNRWIDDSYMLIGKSHFYKRDHIDALEIFNYVIKQYRTEKIRFDGYNWLIRTNTALARFKDAEKMITQLEEDDKLLPKKLRPEIATSKADYHINNGEYGKAKDQLLFAIKNHKRKKSRIRYTFILAQLYTELGMKDSAVHYYTDVLKRSTPYDMEFNARINRALLTSAKSGNVEAIKRELVKMSKDEKNVDYLDRIYFALGNIALDEGDKDAGLAYLLKSVAASTKNIGQKAVSFYTIGDLYFDKPEYMLASAFYDSSMAILPERHKDYLRVKGRQENLAELVKNIRTIARQDSLLKLGNMSESEREAYIQSLIDEVKSEEEARVMAEAQAALNPLQNQQTTQPPLPGASAGTSWYFYNTTAVGYGITDFRQKWGQRKLEDNWRRSVKTANMQTDDADDLAAAVVPVSEKMKPEYYLKDIPVTPEKKDSAHQKIQHAFYDIGVIYKEKLKELQRSIDAFEELLRRYPKGLFSTESYYQLYRLYTLQGNTAKANEYKNKLLREYPDSEYAKMLSDPDYLKKQEALKAQVARNYDRTFTNYATGNHEMVIATADSMLRLLKDDKLRPKFALLRAMSIGATQKLPVYRAALEGVITTYPTEPEKVKAEELLSYVKTLMGEELPDEAPKPEPVPVIEEGYLFEPESNHYFAMVVNKPVAVADVKGRLSNFNDRQFSTESLAVKNVQMSAEQELVFVQGFGTTKKAMDYITALVLDQEFFIDLDRSKMKQFLISEKNFALFYKKKNVEEYMEFFLKNYQ